jgi:hypothetical protein
MCDQTVGLVVGFSLRLPLTFLVEERVLLPVKPRRVVSHVSVVDASG